MNWIKKNRRLVALLGLLAVVAGLGLFLPEQHDHNNVEGIKIEKIEFDSYRNELAQSKEEALGKEFVLIEFFSYRCKFCKQSIPALNELNKHEKLSVIGYSMMGGKKAKKYAKEYGVAYTLSRPSQEYMKIFNPVTVPMSFLIDSKTLEVKAKFTGMIVESEVLSYLK